ncbi:Regulator of microtubule dynamics protein 1 [Strongyloides ratti]|uniref:Regulator of microtubule dynamics protein 1 n=1 Tax=Strongyloides ratti TaxID=34506 RepID=A0A090L5Y1_STRRB|nr:Regulator of microtubule dynamics protein 1 [Strongyloides ratti]CEF63532.1 Regulator of microtubule dynamics protein 1 [Strongyloides ratti]
MFRRVFQSVGKLTAGLASVQLAATGIALTDKELSKKPEWYQHAVRSLEDAIKDLSKKGFIESKEKLAQAEDVLQRVLDVNNVEILWRYARVLTEKAELSHCEHEKKELLHEAKKYIKKALDIEPATGIAGIHKWAGIILTKLGEFDKKCDDEGVKKHLKKATELDQEDAFAHFLYGAQLYKMKEYKEAAEALKKAESIRQGFSPANKYYLGLALKELGKKEEAIQALKESMATPAKFAFEGVAKSKAKMVLMNKFKLTEDEITIKDY